MVAVGQNLSWGWCAVQADVRVPRLHRRDLGVSGRVLRASVSVVEYEALSLLLEA